MDIVDPTQQAELAGKIETASQAHAALLEKLRFVDQELARISGQTAIYEILASVSGQLEELHGMGEGQLFWGDKYTNEQELLGHIKELRVTSDFFNAKFDVIRNKKADVEKEIQDSEYQLALLRDQLDEQKAQDEDKKYDFVIQRVFKPLPYRPMDMPWNKKGEDEKRYRKYLLLALTYSFIVGVLIPLWQLPVPDKNEVVEIPERFAQLLKKEPPKPEPVKEPEPKEPETKPDETKPKEVEPVEVQKAEVPKKVANAGVLAFKDSFADILGDVPDAKLGANAELSTRGTSAKVATRSLVSSSAQSGSGGIRTSALSRDGGTAGGAIGAAEFSRVSSEIGTAVADGRPLSDGPGPSRTDEEIQIVFDRYKAALYRIYNRELRKNPTLQGNMMLRLTIQPNGSVSACTIESSDMDSATLRAGIIERVKRFNFGAKDNVPALTIRYPIDFLPAS